MVTLGSDKCLNEDLIFLPCEEGVNPMSIWIKFLTFLVGTATLYSVVIKRSQYEHASLLKEQKLSLVQVELKMVSWHQLRAIFQCLFSIVWLLVVFSNCMDTGMKIVKLFLKILNTICRSMLNSFSVRLQQAANYWIALNFCLCIHLVWLLAWKGSLFRL